MTSSANTNGNKMNGEEVQPEPGSLAWMVLSIYNDLMQNALHDVVLQAHREEKLSRMQQLQLQAQAGMKTLEQQQQHLQQQAGSGGSSGATADGAEQKSATAANGPAVSPTPLPPTKFPTSNEINPMTIIPKEVLCPKCKNPRHTLETLQAERNGTLPLGPNGEKKKFCSKLPYQKIALHDIYGNPFPTVSTSAKDKKAKAAAAALAAANQNSGTGENGADTPSTGDTTPPRDFGGISSQTGSTVTIAIPTGTQKKADAVVYFKCASCQSEKIAAQRYTGHLVKCLGFAGRKSSRNAVVKLSENGNGSGAGTPATNGEVVGKTSPALDENLSDRKASFSGSVLGESEEIATQIPPVTLDNTKVVNATPKKKKKKDGAAGKEDKDSTPKVKDTPSTKPEVLKDGSPVLTKVELKESKESKDQNVPPSKKRKRKTDIPDNVKPATNGDTFKDEKEGSITVAKAKPPPPKKQKLMDGASASAVTGTEGAGTADRATASPVLKKSQISKFKDRESPAPSGIGGGGGMKKDKPREHGPTSTPSGSNSTSPIISHSKLKKSASPAPSSFPPNSSPKISHAKLGSSSHLKDKDRDRDKDHHGSSITSNNSKTGLSKKPKDKDSSNNVSSSSNKPKSGNSTPKIAKKTLPGSNPSHSSNNSNNHSSLASSSAGSLAPGGAKISGKTLPTTHKITASASPTLAKREKPDTSSPKKHTSGGGGGTVLKQKGSKPSGAHSKLAKSSSGSVGGGGIAGKTVPGKTVPGKRAVPAGGFSGGGGGGGDGSEGGIPRKKPKAAGE